MINNDNVCERLHRFKLQAKLLLYRGMRYTALAAHPARPRRMVFWRQSL
jgi:hypothetical protein